MNDEDAKHFVDLIFEKISKANTISELEQIENTNFDVSQRMRISDFPKIEFKITTDEIEQLKASDILINEDHEFSKNITSLITDPLAKILFATCWKNGDLNKIKHIINGIQDAGSNNGYPDSALVFYQFGRYLTKTPSEPIIDQHVIRAWAVKNTVNLELIRKHRMIGTLGKNEVVLVKSYKAWLMGNPVNTNLKDHSDFNFMIDRILYATGKKIKTYRT